MESLGKRSLLFVHSSGPTHVNHRDKSIKTKIRRHIMVDIGRARRKPPRNPKIDNILYLPTNLEEERVDSNGNVSDKASRNRLIAKSMDDWTVAPLALPFWDQHPLATLEKQCGMDMFSAYGITLVLAEGRNPAGTGERISLVHLLLLPSDFSMQLIPPTIFGSPLPSENLPSSVSFDRFSPAPMYSKPCI